ncbi:hypothetical protein ACFFRR_001988 [Megaselia abdita]
MTEVLLNPDKLCRVCLRADEEFQSIFEENIYKMIEEVSIYKVKREDDLPVNICIRCKTNLYSAYSFKQLCERSYRRLYDHFKILSQTSDDVFSKYVPETEKFTQTDFPSLYPCEKCTDKFTTPGDLISHRRQFHLKSAHECRICHTKFQRLQTLQAHLAIKHPESGFVKTDTRCSECSKVFTRKEHYRRHMLRVHKKYIKPGQRGRHSFRTREKEETLVEATENEDVKPKALEEEAVLDIQPQIDAINYLALDMNDVVVENVVVETISEPPLIIKREEVEFEHNPYESELEDDGDHFDDYEDDDNIPLSEVDLVKPEVEVENVKEEMPEDVFAIEFPFAEPKEESMEESGDKKKYKCGDCEKAFTRPEQLRKHYKTLHPTSVVEPMPLEERKFKCLDCDKAFYRHDHLKRHMSIHTGEKPFSCEFCGLQFRRKDGYNIHLRKHEEKRPFECEKCKKGFLRKDSLKEHIQKGCERQKTAEKLFGCYLCDKKFVSQKSLLNHIKQHSEKRFECSFCKAMFSYKSDLGEHIKNKHSDERPFLCSECGARFSRNDYLVVHMRRHTGEKPFTCKFCGKGFPRSTDLNVHEKYHTGTKPHLCTICGKSFHRRYNLTIHTRVHTGEKPYSCPHCGKCFSQGNDLKAHIRRHTGERFKCEVCNEGFVQLYNLSQHKFNVHGIQVQSNIKRLEKFIPEVISTGETQQQQPMEIQTQDPPAPEVVEHSPREGEQQHLSFVYGN